MTSVLVVFLLAECMFVSWTVDDMYSGIAVAHRPQTKWTIIFGLGCLFTYYGSLDSDASSYTLCALGVRINDYDIIISYRFEIQKENM